jgi:hypothetical protein
LFSNLKAKATGAGAKANKEEEQDPLEGEKKPDLV